MEGGKKNENGRKRELATDPRSKRAQEKNTPFGHTPHSDQSGALFGDLFGAIFGALVGAQSGAFRIPPNPLESLRIL